MHEKTILKVLDGCCVSCSFPMLDNGYVYLAATRMSLFRSSDDWAIVIEVFGFSPRAGDPDVYLYTFGSSLRNRPQPESYVSHEAFDRYIANNPNNEFSSFYPLDLEAVLDPDDPELIGADAKQFVLRGNKLPMPSLADFANAEIDLESHPRIHVFELCRLLAHRARDEVLATTVERNTKVPSHLELIMVLDEWHHPDVVDPTNKLSNSETLQQISKVLVTGDINHYLPSLEANTHWKNWPGGGTL